MHPTSAPHASEDGLEPSDIELMELLKSGDEAAFETLVERHQYAVVGTVAKMLGSPADAEDIAQMVFIRVWKSAERYSPTAKFTTWLMTITRNLVFNELRRHHRHSTVSLDASSNDRDALHDRIDSSTPAADKVLLEGELQDAIDRAIASLPEKARMAIILRRYQEMAYEEIAEVLQTTVPSVKSLLFRARTDLKAALEKYL